MQSLGFLGFRVLGFRVYGFWYRALEPYTSSEHKSFQVAGKEAVKSTTHLLQNRRPPLT